MAAGSLSFRVTDLRQRPVDGTMRVELTPHASGSGGQRMNVEFLVDGHDDFTITEIACRGGAGTLYTICVFADGYRPYAFFQMIQEGKNRPSEGHLRLMVNPKKVERIHPPPFEKLPAAFRTALGNAQMMALAEEDRQLLGLAGHALYDALGPLRQACMLNLVAKAAHASAGRVVRFVQTPAVLRQDRCFAVVSPEMPEALRKSALFKSAPSVLHEPPKGFERRDSFKTLDAHGNLQVTFMQARATEALWADIDIDLASGIEHGFEVIKNTLVNGKTNPFVVRDLLLRGNFDPLIDPGYDVELK